MPFIHPHLILPFGYWKMSSNSFSSYYFHFYWENVFYVWLFINIHRTIYNILSRITQEIFFTQKWIAYFRKYLSYAPVYKYKPYKAIPHEWPLPAHHGRQQWAKPWGVLPYLCMVARFNGDDPHFGDFQSDWVSILYHNIIWLTPLSAEKNLFVSITLFNRFKAFLY